MLSFLPPEACHALTAMSERALAYGEEPLKNRMLVLYEAEGMSGETASYLIRSLLSEGCVRYETVEKTPRGLQARLIEREGPTGLIVTTTRVAFVDGSLYVIDINKLIKYENAEANLDKLGDGKVVYDDMPPFVAHGWKYLVADKDGWLYLPFGPPFNIGIPPTSVSQIRRVDPRTGNAEIVALGVRNSVGGDIDPRTGKYWFTENARDWLGDDGPSDKLNVISRLGEHFGYPYCHQGNMPDPKFAMGHQCSEFTPPVLNLGNHVAPLGMKFYTGDQFPPEYKNSILIAEHGSWNRHKYQGAQLVRVTADPDGKNAKQEVFASGWINGDQSYLGRPDDIIVAKDGSILVSDDWAGAIYRISYSKQ